jgi:glycerophosphoryl diester phosphodiesterase
MQRNRRIPLVLGHRGYRARFPENTLLAFAQAIAAGADGIECDLQKSADGRYVVIHDHTTDRVTGMPREVARSSLEELRGLDFGSGEKIPTLEELLAALPAHAYLDLELKEETLTRQDADSIAAILDAGRPRDRLMVSSFDPRLLYPFRTLGFTVGYLVGEDAAGKGLGGFIGELFRLRPQYVNLPVDALSMLGRRRAVLLFQALRAFGIALLFWTVNSAEDAAVLAPHARIIVTDEVEKIVGSFRLLRAAR